MLNPLNVSAVAIPVIAMLPDRAISSLKVAEPPNVDTPVKLKLLSILMSPEMTTSPNTLRVV